MTATAAQYAALAAKQVGKPYVLGQPVPYKGGNPGAFDCSGIVIWLNNQTGALPMGDDTAAGLYNRSKAVTGTPAVGDLVFLRNNPARSNGIGHVAVLTQRLSNGDWRIVEARGKTSGVVATTLSYWKTRRYYTGIRRLTGFKLASAPAPTPKPGKETKLWVTTYNCVADRPGWGGKVGDDNKVIAAAAASVYLLVEATSRIRTAIRKAKKGGLARWLVWNRTDAHDQTIMFDRTKQAHTTRVPLSLGGYHGAVMAILTHRVTGQKIQFVTVHLQPKKLATEASRKKAFETLMGAVSKTLPVIIGGDFNSEAVESWAKPHGFTVAKTGATVDHGKRYDWLLIRGGSWTKAETHNPGAASDHLAVRAHAVIPAIPTT
ncbi:MAG TPA: NlpC/P60 family protein [Propionicimonas sp.]|nr:NlpC/P60 family protein [Propionicimonas sp.]